MKYWANINGVQYGPVEKEELLGLGLTKDSFVWREGIEDWVMVRNFNELTDLFPEQEQPEVKPAEEIFANEQPEQDSPEEEKQSTPVPPQIPQQPFTPIQPTFTQPQAPRQPEKPQEPCPPTNMVWAILTTLLCCQVLGIIAIIYAAQVSSRYYAGDIECAKKYSERAAMWSIASIVVGLLYLPFAIIFQLLSMF